LLALYLLSLSQLYVELLFNFVVRDDCNVRRIGSWATQVLGCGFKFRFFCFVFFCVGRDLAMDQSTVQQNVLRYFLLLELVLAEEGKNSMHHIFEH
jgi:hypothetical protein